MQRPRFLAKRWIIVMSIVMILLALVIWTIRPSPFSEWLGSAELSNFSTPLSILRAWADDRLAPMTPIGFITLFPLYDLLIFAALFTALCILLVLLPAQWRNQRTGSWLTRPVPLHRLPRIGIRVRTAMVLIAILGLDLGWEIVAWRSWRLRQEYLGQAASHGRSEAHWRDGILRAEIQLGGLNGETPAWPEASWTPAARAAERAYSRDQWQRESQHASREAAYYAELRRKYERAAADLPTHVPPDPPLLNEQQQPSRGILLAQGKYAQALAESDDLIRLYPDLVWAHEQRAWILATCPDAKIRDGKLAVAAATHAAELTNWKDWTILRALAAAYAEVGDSANAVRWQQRALEEEQEFSKRFPPPNPGGMTAPRGADPALELYKAGKPNRIGR